MLGVGIRVCGMLLLIAATSPKRPDDQIMTAPPMALHLVNVDGRHVAFHVSAGSSPTVVFEAGGGLDGSAWEPVLGGIYRRTGARLITFDRAGFGDSDEDKRPAELQHEVDDLKAGLTALGATHGIVLVAHSFGGEVGLVFASQNPGWIARAVLVDTNIPVFFTNTEISKEVDNFPKHLDLRTRQLRSMSALLVAFPSMQHGFHTMRWPNAIPASIIVSEHPPFATAAENSLWIKDHREFGQAAPNRSFEIAKGSGHLVMKDRPALVADAVVQAVLQARATRRSQASP